MPITHRFSVRKASLATVTAGLVTLAALSSGAAANAVQSRSLPSGETLYAVSCDYTNSAPLGQLASIDTATAVASAIGTGSTNSHANCAAQGALDQSTQLLYWASWDATPNYLFKTNTATGVSTPIGTLTVTSGPTFDISSLMMGRDGVLYAVYALVNGSNWNYGLGRVDTSTGAITAIATLTNGGSVLADPKTGSNSGKLIFAAAFNPADNTYYVIHQTTLFAINVSNAALTSAGNNGDNNWWWSLAFDSNGTMWSTGDGDLMSSTVTTWATAGSQQKSAHNLQLNGADWYSESNVISWQSVAPSPTPTPTQTSAAAAEAALASTGFGLEPWAAMSALLLLLGGSASYLRRKATK